MKKILLASLFLILSIGTFAQARLGYSEQGIRDEFPDNDFTVSYDENNNKLLDTEFSHAVVRYILSNDVCYKTLILPKSDEDLNALIRRYNSNYVSISSTEWKQYTRNGIVNIKLVYVDNTPVFIFSIEK